MLKKPTGLVRFYKPKTEKQNRIQDGKKTELKSSKTQKIESTQNWSV